MFDLEVVLYLCLGGLGGGLSMVAGVAGSSIPRSFLEDDLLSSYSDLMRPTFVVSGASLVLGSLFLLVDSNNFSALVHLFFAPHYSYLSVGAWLILIDIGLCLVLMLFWGIKAPAHTVVISRILHALCALTGLATALYTGLFLASMRAVPLWNTPWLSVLFVLSAISCGIVLFLALMQANDEATTFPQFRNLLAKIDIFVVVLEALCAAALVLSMVASPISDPTAAAGVDSAFNLMAGEHAWIWWGGFVGLGLIATAMFDVLVIRSKDNRPGRIWSTLGVSFCVLVGVFAVRYCIVGAGAHPALGF